MIIHQIVDQVMQSRRLTPEVADQIDAIMWDPDLPRQDLEALANLVYAISLGIVQCPGPVAA